MSKWIVIISLALFSLNCRQANGKELTRVSMDSIADMVGFRANGSLRLLATRGFEFTISDGSKTQKVVGKGFDKKDIIKCKFSANFTLFSDLISLFPHNIWKFTKKCDKLEQRTGGI